MQAARLLLALVCIAGVHAAPEATPPEREAPSSGERATSKPAKQEPGNPAEKKAASQETTPSGDITEVTTLPEMEIRRTRIHELDIKIRQLDREITRERRKIKSSDTDKALNSEKASRFMSVFGGKSAAQRSSVAAERVHLMESERELLEVMKLPKTREELTLLQQQVDALRKVRRDLDIELR